MIALAKCLQMSIKSGNCRNDRFSFFLSVNGIYWNCTGSAFYVCVMQSPTDILPDCLFDLYLRSGLQNTAIPDLASQRKQIGE